MNTETNSTHTVDPGQAIVVQVDAGSRLRIIDLEGSQVSDVLAIVRDDTTERVSTAETLNLNFSFTVPVGECFYTNRRRPALRLVHDDSAGAFDLTNACCSPEFYEKWAGDPDHPNCRDAFDAAFQEIGIDSDHLPDPINIFQVTKRADDGSFIDEPSRTSPGDRVEFIALVDLWVGVSSCPCDLSGPEGSITGGGPSPVRVDVLSNAPRETE